MDCLVRTYKELFVTRDALTLTRDIGRWVGLYIVPKFGSFHGSCFGPSSPEFFITRPTMVTNAMHPSL